MDLNYTKRAVACKTEVKRLRREGKIPAILYSEGKKGEEIAVDGNELKKILNRLEQGTLSTQVFMLSDGGKKRKAIIKDIQYKVTSYDIIHLDFEELHDNVSVNVNIPIRCVGAAECAGVKLGGFLRQIIRAMRVRCLPKDIPALFEVDVRELHVGQSKKLRDLVIPKNVKPMADLKEVAVVVSKR